MSKRADGRAGGRAGTSLALAAVLSLMASAAPLLAQVGHEPARSPFRDITTRQSLTLLAGRFSGNSAEAGTGALPGPVFGLRLRTRLSGPLELMATVASIQSERRVIDPSQPEGSRESGPVRHRLIAADLGLLLTLTGAKTWHGLAPYVGAGLGITAPTDSRVDPGGFRAKTGFTVAPTLGLRWYAGQRLGLNLEIRDNTIRYEWPLAYFTPRDANNNPLPPVLESSQFDSRDVAHNLTLFFGLSYHFNF